MKIMSPPRQMLVMYGSQTGTAQAVAERIGREAKRYHFETKVKAMNDFGKPLEQLVEEPLTVFVCATTGQGDQPDNMMTFWRSLLKRTLPKDILNGHNFAVLGLGDSGYAQFNYAAKRLNRRLSQLGGHSIVNIGLADDQHDLGQDFIIDPWVTGFFAKALEMFPLPLGISVLSSDILPPPKYKIEFAISEEKTHNNSNFEPNNKVFDSNHPYLATLISNDRVTHENHFQDTRLVELNIGNEISYNPGDVCLVQPSNSNANVNKFLELFAHLEPDKFFTLISNDDENIELPPKSVLWNNRTTLRECAERVLDLQAIPGRYFFELLAKFSKDDLEKEKFIEFTTTEGQQELFDYCNRPRRNSLEVLFDFSLHTTPNIPLEYLFDLFPLIKPRSFSISNSLKVVPNKIQLLVAVVKYKSKLVEPRLGLCSNFLANCNLGEKIPIWIKSGTMKIPQDPKIPLIMVGPGTGVAPFRSMIQDELGSGAPRPLVLIFGCRNKTMDFYFDQDWSKLAKESSGLFSIFTAFSRDQEDKIYVQHVIENLKLYIGDLIVNQDAFVYIAGNAKQMPDQVKDALIEAILSIDDDGDKQGATAFLNQMSKEKRLQMETWS